jgi:hypothetical protein
MLMHIIFFIDSILNATTSTPSTPSNNLSSLNLKLISLNRRRMVYKIEQLANANK